MFRTFLTSLAVALPLVWLHAPAVGQPAGAAPPPAGWIERQFAGIAFWTPPDWELEADDDEYVVFARMRDPKEKYGVFIGVRRAPDVWDDTPKLDRVERKETVEIPGGARFDLIEGPAKEHGVTGRFRLMTTAEPDADGMTTMVAIGGIGVPDSESLPVIARLAPLVRAVASKRLPDGAPATVLDGLIAFTPPAGWVQAPDGDGVVAFQTAKGFESRIRLARGHGVAGEEGILRTIVGQRTTDRDAIAGRPFLGISGATSIRMQGPETNWRSEPGVAFIALLDDCLANGERIGMEIVATEPWRKANAERIREDVIETIEWRLPPDAGPCDTPVARTWQGAEVALPRHWRPAPTPAGAADRPAAQVWESRDPETGARLIFAISQSCNQAYLRDAPQALRSPLSVDGRPALLVETEPSDDAGPVDNVAIFDAPASIAGGRLQPLCIGLTVEGETARSAIGRVDFQAIVDSLRLPAVWFGP